MKELENLFDKNKAWAKSVTDADPDFFSKLSKQQAPEYLWIGCSDSRVPANQIIDLPPGEVFVHRNIANVVVHTDLNCLSVIQYAVEVLKVKHIIVCGHYGCGGIECAEDGHYHGLIDNWLGHIQDVARMHEDKLAGLSKQDRLDYLCELNVIEQVRNVCNTSVLTKAWAEGANVTVSGWVYNVGNGLLQGLGMGINGKEALTALNERLTSSDYKFNHPLGSR